MHYFGVTKKLASRGAVLYCTFVIINHIVFLFPDTITESTSGAESKCGKIRKLSSKFRGNFLDCSLCIWATGWFLKECGSLTGMIPPHCRNAPPSRLGAWFIGPLKPNGGLALGRMGTTQDKHQYCTLQTNLCMAGSIPTTTPYHKCTQYDIAWTLLAKYWQKT